MKIRKPRRARRNRTRRSFRQPARRSLFSRLSFEPLEDRRLLATFNPTTPTALTAGDVVPLAMNGGGGNEEIAFMPLVDIAGGTVLWVTDVGVTAGGGSTFASQTISIENIIKWTAPGGGVTAGTVVAFTSSSGVMSATVGFLNQAGDSATADGTYNTGTGAFDSSQKDLNFNGAGDQLTIYQTSDNTALGGTKTFLWCFSTAELATAIDADNNGFLDSGSPSSVTTHLPAGLTALNDITGGGNAANANANGIFVDDDGHAGTGNLGQGSDPDNWRYNGPVTSADAATWRTRINTLANWQHSANSGGEFAVTGAGAGALAGGSLPVSSGGAPEIDVQRPASTSIADDGSDNLGDQTVGTVMVTYVIDNTAGTGQLDVTGATATSTVNVSSFSVVTGLPLNIAAGNTANLTVQFTVNTAAAFSFDMDIANNDADENPYDIAVSGTGVFPSSLPDMGPEPVALDTTCSSMFFDSGGSGGSYAPNENYVQTIVSDTPGNQVRVTFSLLHTETGLDVLSVYDGPTTGSPLIGNFSGTGSTPGPFTSTSGSLTFRFVSDASAQGQGWAATVACLAPGTTAVTLAGNTLKIDDVDGADSDDQLVLSYSGGMYTLTDTGGLILTTAIAGATGDGTSTLTIPDSGVTGINFNLAGGDDAVTVDSVQALLSGGFTIAGLAGTDSATINGPINAGGPLNISAEIIELAADLTTTANVGLDGAVVLSADVVVNGSTVNFSGTVDSGGGGGFGGFMPATGSPFAAPTTFSGSMIAAADYDGNGAIDIATVKSNGAIVLLNDGSAGFTPAPGSPFGSGSFFVGIATADFDGSSGPDLVLADFSGGNAAVLLNNGSGGFTAAVGSPYTAGGASYVATGDLDGVNGPDFIVGNYNGNNVAVYLNNGSGGFTPAAGSPYATGATQVPEVEVGDFDGINGLDFVSVNRLSDSVTLFLNNGAGGFVAGSPISVGSTPWGVAVGDLDGVNGVDLVVAHNNGGVSFLLNNGSGGFGTPTSLLGGTGYYEVELGDLDGTGSLDVVVSNKSSGQVFALLNDGSAGFSAAAGSPYAAGTQPYGVGLADFDGNGSLDIATGNDGGNGVNVLLNQTASGGTWNLTVNTSGSGTTTFSGAIGGASPLNNLTTNADGSTHIAADIVVDGAVVLNDAVVLTADVTISAGGAATFGGTIDSDSTARDLTVNAAGATQFNGVVGGGAALDVLTTDAAGTTTINTTGATAAEIDLADAVTVAVDSVLTADEINFGGGSDSVSGAVNLTLAPLSTAANIVVGGSSDSSASVLDLTDADLSALADGFTSIVIGDSASGAGTVTTDTVALDDPVTLAGGNIVSSGGTDVTAPGTTLDGNTQPGGPSGVGQMQIDSNLVFDGSLTVDLNGAATAGTDYDQVSVLGASRTVNLNNLTFAGSLGGGYTPMTGDELVIIDLADAGSSITGTFNGLAQGATLSIGGQDFTINYAGGDGNDVVITVPAPVTCPSFMPTTTPELIACINDANVSSADDTIELGGMTFTLDAVDNTTNGDNGLPSIVSAATAGTLTVQNGTIERDTAASADFRIFHLASNADLTLNNVTIQNGIGGGGAIRNLGGNLAIADSTFVNN